MLFRTIQYPLPSRHHPAPESKLFLSWQMLMSLDFSFLDLDGNCFETYPSSLSSGAPLSVVPIPLIASLTHSSQFHSPPNCRCVAGGTLLRNFPTLSASTCSTTTSCLPAHAVIRTEGGRWRTGTSVCPISTTSYSLRYMLW